MGFLYKDNEIDKISILFYAFPIIFVFDITIYFYVLEWNQNFDNIWHMQEYSR